MQLRHSRGRQFRRTICSDLRQVSTQYSRPLNANTKATCSLPESRFAAFEDIANVFADCGILKTTRFIGDFRKEAGSMRTTMGDDHLIRVGIHD